MPTQAELHQALLQKREPETRRDLALELLARTQRRQYLDDCLRLLGSPALRATLDESHRPVLRAKCLSLFKDDKRDKAGLLRERLTRLLVYIGHHEDADIYRLGVETYHLQPVDDVAQNLRAAALAGLAPLEPELACLYAARFLGEPHTSVFNCEPALTALDLLVAADQPLPIYQFLLRDGIQMARTARGELTGKALESLGDAFPIPLYAGLIEQYRQLDQPTASLGIVNWVIERRAKALYDDLEALVMGTKDMDLRRYGLVMMAAARDDRLSQSLLRLAKTARRDELGIFIEALEICQHDERDAAIERLRRRL